MRKNPIPVVPFLSVLLFASCASAPSPKETAPTPTESAPTPREVAFAQPESLPAQTPPEVCQEMFIPVTNVAQDKDEEECEAPQSSALRDYPKGKTCKLEVDYVRPTQPAVGMTAVNCKRDNLVSKSEKQLDKYLRKGKRVMPTVIGPDGNYYVTDHHHLATGVYKTLEEKPEEQQGIRLYAEIVGNFFTDPSRSPSDEEMKEFWDVKMAGCNNAYLSYLGKPVDPLNPEEMPRELSRMKDDPYRTLSRWVRDADGYIKPSVHPANFLEFTWGDKFRRDLDQQITLCAIHESVESNDCQEQIQELRQGLDEAMTSARAYDSVQWIEDGNCAGDAKGDPEALVACGYNPDLVIVAVDKYITADRGCETAEDYSWEEVGEAAEPPPDTLAWFQYAHGHVTESYRVCRVADGGALFAGVFDPQTGRCSYVDGDAKVTESKDFGALTGVQAMYLWSEYTEEIADEVATDDDDFFDDAIPVGDSAQSSSGETYVCASGDRIGWVTKGKKKCHLSKDGQHVPFAVLTED